MRPHIERPDLDPFFLDPARADASWRLLDGRGDGRPTAADVRDAVLGVQAQRATLAATLTGARKAARSLELAVGVLLHALCILAYLAIFGVGRLLVCLMFVILCVIMCAC